MNSPSEDSLYIPKLKDAKPGETIHFIVAEDNPDTQRGMVHYIHSIMAERPDSVPYTISVCDNGKEAYKKVMYSGIMQDHTILITDFEMPGGDGADLYYQIRHHKTQGREETPPEFKRMPVIFTLGYSEFTPNAPDDRIDIVFKPVIKETLKKSLDFFLPGIERSVQRAIDTRHAIEEDHLQKQSGGTEEEKRLTTQRAIEDDKAVQHEAELRQELLRNQANKRAQLKELSGLHEWYSQINRNKTPGDTYDHSDHYARDAYERELARKAEVDRQFKIMSGDTQRTIEGMRGEHVSPMEKIIGDKIKNAKKPPEPPVR